MTSERVAAIKPNGRCLDVVNGSNLKSATQVESTEVTMTSTDVRTVSSTAESPMPGAVDVKFEVVVARTGDNSAAVAARFGARPA